MSISASSIASSATLNELRTQFNNLVTDVTAIEGGSISYTTLNTTTTNATTLNVKEDGTIVFEGATDDGFETTLTVVDPTADRTITFPNETGTVHTTGGTTTHTNIIIGDGGNIGSASDTDAIAIAANGNITVNQNLSVGGNLDVTGTLDLSDSNFTNVGSIQLDSIAGDGDTNTSITFSGSDVITIATGGSTAATFNASQVTTLSGNLIIPDAGNIGSASDTNAIAIGADGDVTLTQDLELQHDGAILSFGADDDVTLTHVADTGLLLNGTSQLQFYDASQNITAASATVLDINATDEIELNATLIDVNANLDVSGTYSGGGLMTTGGNIVIPNAGNIGSADDTDAIAIGSDGDVTLTQDLELQHDGASIAFGTNDEITLTHVHDTGLLLADSGGSPTLQLHDSAESVSSDGSKLILTSNSVAFSLPTADGSNGQALATNGSGVLSFVDVSSAADDLTAGDSAVTLTTTSGNITVDAQGNDTDIIFKGTDGSSDTTFLTIDGSDAGTLIANHDLELGTDGSIIKFGADNEITLTHVADTGLLLEDSGGSPTIQLHDSNESVSSDGTNLILTSGGTAFKIPTSDGSSGQALGTNGSGTLSFVNVASAADDLTAGDAAVNITTTSGNITIDAQANDSDVIIKGTDATADITMATFDGSDAGTLILNHDLELGTDAALIKFGADNEITLTHVADTGLLLEDSGGSPTLQFHNSSESVSSDGSKLILTSNGVAFSLPTADGSNGQSLQTNGSGVLSFASASSTGAFTAFEYTATAGQTSFSGNDDNSNSLAYTSGVNNVFVSVNGVMLDGSDYTATNGTAVVLAAAAAANDMIKILATNTSSITTADLNGAEFVLDADGDTTIHADTDDQIDIKIAGADDFRFTANNFNVLSGSTLTIDSGATITNSGTASGFGLSTGKAIVLSMLFGR